MTTLFPQYLSKHFNRIELEAEYLISYFWAGKRLLKGGNNSDSKPTVQATSANALNQNSFNIAMPTAITSTLQQKSINQFQWATTHCGILHNEQSD